MEVARDELALGGESCALECRDDEPDFDWSKFPRKLLNFDGGDMTIRGIRAAHPMLGGRGPGLCTRLQQIAPFSKK